MRINLDHSLVEQSQNSTLSNTKPSRFKDEDLIDLAENNAFLDEYNVQLIIVNEANQDALLMTSNDIKLSNEAAKGSNLIAWFLQK